MIQDIDFQNIKRSKLSIGTKEKKKHDRSFLIFIVPVI